jgi:hypothetical protein
MLGRIDSNANGLRESVILVDHQDAMDANMQQEQIQPSGNSSFQI